MTTLFQIKMICFYARFQRCFPNAAWQALDGASLWLEEAMPTGLALPGADVQLLARRTTDSAFAFPYGAHANSDWSIRRAFHAVALPRNRLILAHWAELNKAFQLNQVRHAWHSPVCSAKKVPDAQGTQLPSLISTKPEGQRKAFSTWKALEWDKKGNWP